MSIDNLIQLRQWQPPYRPDALIEDGILLPGTTMMLFGAAGSWKTMSSVHLACCLARGEPWFSYKTTTATVLMHQAELPKFQAKERALKYIDNNHKSSSNLFFYTSEDNMFLDTTYGIKELEKQIDEVKRRADQDLPIVVILDPLKHYMKGHISDEYDVSAFQRNIDPIRKKKNITFVIVHHARLTSTDNAGQVIDLGAEELMGSSYWNNWLDTIMRLKVTNPFAGSDTIQMSFGKHRNAQNFHPSFTVKWKRSTLEPEIVQRDIIEDEEPSVRNLVGGDE